MAYSNIDPLEEYPENSKEKQARREILKNNPCAYSNCHYANNRVCPYLNNRVCPYFTPVWAH